MNQNRWTCLATVVLTTVIGPIATVNASTRSAPIVGNVNNYIPVSPQSLPTITPLVVTELDTEVVTPATIKPVPQVSSLPVVTPINRKTKARTRSKQHQTIRNQGKNPVLQSPVAKLPVVNPIFNSNFRVTAPMGSISTPNHELVATVNPVAPLPLPFATISKAQVVTPFASPTPMVATMSTNIDAIDINSLPQVSPIASNPKDRSSLDPQAAEIPNFESGVPVFGLNNGQSQQIVNTVIAQVGDTIVAPEPSIAIPVEVPKQPTVSPIKSPGSVPPLVQPEGTGIVKIQPPAATTKPATEIVKIQQPATTTKPALDKIVATQSGQASWYGIEGGSQTANGERYIPSGLTAAHRTLPFGTKVRVTSLKTGKTVTVRINDRGPFHSRRIIDVSAGAAEVIGIKNDGIGDVKMEVLGKEG